MKKILTTTAIVFFGTAVLAQSTDFEARITAELETQGYTILEVETEGSELLVEAVRDGVEFEFTYDSASEDLLSVEESPFEDEEDEDADEDDHDEDDDDEDDHEDDEEDDDEDDEDEEDEDGDADKA